MMWDMSASWVFFFQAEDGIRDLVRSRGLGDVYKRQVLRQARRGNRDESTRACGTEPAGLAAIPLATVVPVSYTHLTLPTSDLV